MIDIYPFSQPCSTDYYRFRRDNPFAESPKWGEETFRNKMNTIPKLEFCLKPYFDDGTERTVDMFKNGCDKRITKFKQQVCKVSSGDTLEVR